MACLEESPTFPFIRPKKIGRKQPKSTVRNKANTTSRERERERKRDEYWGPTDGQDKKSWLEHTKSQQSRGYFFHKFCIYTVNLTLILIHDFCCVAVILTFLLAVAVVVVVVERSKTRNTNTGE